MARQVEEGAQATARAHAECAEALRVQAAALRATAAAFRAVAAACRNEAGTRPLGNAEERVYEAKVADKRADISDAEARTCEREAGAAASRAKRSEARCGTGAEARRKPTPAESQPPRPAGSRREAGRVGTGALTAAERAGSRRRRSKSVTLYRHETHRAHDAVGRGRDRG